MKRVVMVGAGVVGLFCAVRLAKAGARVTIVEAEGEFASPYGPGASAAAAGMLAPLEHKASPHERIALDSFDLWKRLSKGAVWADGVRFDGGVIVAENIEAAEALKSNVARLGRSAEPLSSSQFRKRTGFRAKLENAVFLEDEGVADPVRVLSGLAMEARAHGVIIDYEQDVENATDNTVLAHDGAVYEADSVILSPGAWATQKLIAAAPALRFVTPSKGHIASVEIAHRLGPNLRTHSFYLAQRLEEAVIGSTMEPGVYERRVDRAQVEKLFAAADALLPGEVRLTDRVWAGIRPMSPDGWPIIGPTGDGILVAAGHSRNGWLMAPITAEIISAYVFGAELSPEWAALSPARFETA